MIGLIEVNIGVEPEQWFPNFGNFVVPFQKLPNTRGSLLKILFQRLNEDQKRGYYFKTASDFFIFVPKVKWRLKTRLLLVAPR